MSLSDPISNLLTNIRNASRIQHETVDIPASKLSEKILEIFKQDGYIENFRLLKDNKQGILKVYLKYDKNRGKAITDLKRVSKSSRRVYVHCDEIPRVLNGLGTAVISTSKGIMTDREARKNKIGGEVLCYIW
ncbi:MAG TPA: 30S ribosomal protein S8 [Candidatus Omnitrophota bacterium]|nr:30S ribosomal protein S8 [Candidatus Omnitrophota bacterium]HPD83952.1 30S ribosomal protein S8 [Candidatus Omnitrophota bacterium]HRZ02809.1 30S ribosomal protein S8 [Candidatus Omnitrophota bacterium]